MHDMKTEFRGTATPVILNLMLDGEYCNLSTEYTHNGTMFTKFNLETR